MSFLDKLREKYEAKFGNADGKRKKNASFFDLLPPKARRFFLRQWFDEKRRRAFYEKVAELLENGVGADEILLSLQRRAAKRKKNSLELKLYESMTRGFNDTGHFYEAVGPYVPTIDNILIRSGEESGRLTKTLRSAADLNAKGSKMRSYIVKAIAYPSVTVIATIGILCWFSVSVFPGLEDFLPVEKWPPISRFTYMTGRYIIEYYPVALAIMTALGAFVVWSFAHLTGTVRIYLDKIPPWSIYRLAQGGAWILSISSMVASGAQNNLALSTIYEEAKGNWWLRQRTKAVQTNIKNSQSMGEALSTKYMFPDEELCEDMADYAKSAKFTEIFEKVGREWVDTGVIKVEAQSKILNGVALVFSFIMIGFVLQALMGLMMDVSNVISAGGGPKGF